MTRDPLAVSRPFLHCEGLASPTVLPAEAERGVGRVPEGHGRRVLFLVEGDPVAGLSPASRFRVYQYIPHLEALGFRCVVRPSRPPKYFAGDLAFRQHLERHPLLARLAWAMKLQHMVWNRWRDILSARHYDAVFLQRDLLPIRVAALEGLLRRINQRVIFDFDDAIFVRPSWAAARTGEQEDRRLRAKVEWIIAGARAVVVSNGYLADFARRLNAVVHVIPTPVDTDRLRPREPRRQRGAVVLGWIGTAANLFYLREMEALLRRLGERHQFQVKIVCNPAQPAEYPSLPPRMLQICAWSLDREAEHFSEMDIGIMPLRDDAWTRGKAAFKLLQFMAAGIPVVASAVGHNVEVIRDGMTGFLARTPEEWSAAVGRLAGDPELR
ncbi:MAG: glycosyltransferase family 4 protein, partial [Gemmatimonadales bacterium]